MKKAQGKNNPGGIGIAMNRKIKVFFISFFSLMIYPCIVLSAIFYVSPSGNNQNQGNEDNPWATVQYAINNAKAGDTVYITEGTYYESLNFNTNSGTSSNPIIFQNYPGEIVTIESSDADPAIAISISHIRIKGFRVHKATATAEPIRISAGTDVVVDNSEFWGGSWQAVHITNENGDISYIKVKNCNIHNPPHEGIYVQSYNNNQIQYIYFENNIVHDCPDEAIQISGERYSSNPPSNIYISRNEIYNVGAWAIIHLYYAPQNIIIEGNYIHDCTTCWVGIALDGATSIIRNNIMRDCSGSKSDTSFAGIDIGSQHGNPRFEIYHNTFTHLTRGVSPNAFGIAISPNQYITHSYTKNNIFSNIQDYAIYNCGPLSNIEYNLFYKAGDGNAIYDNGIIYTYSNVNTLGIGNIVGNPTFVDPKNNDFHLQSNSPVIDAGINVGISVDFEGNFRPQKEGFDIGAFEFHINAPFNAPQNLRIVSTRN